MARLTDAELAELERAHERLRNAGEGYCVWAETELFAKLYAMVPAILAELRALRSVRDAAERYREELHNYECVPVSVLFDNGIDTSKELVGDARKAIFAALDAARGEA